MKPKLKILLVEDDKFTAKVVRKYLIIRDYEVIHCLDGKAGYEEFLKQDFDLCILDILMPHKDGFTLAQDIRALDEFIPILFLSSKSLSEDRIKAFKIGGDDFITKPFDPEELALRVEVLMKRQLNLPKKPVLEEALPNRISIGKYLFDFKFQRLAIGDFEVKLTTREAELLRFLYIHANELVRRELILLEIWGSDDYYKGRSLDVFISRLRKYLKEDSDIEIINVHAIGFKLAIASANQDKEEFNKVES
jgi:DNA-binding response OmpR family regulator